MPGLATSTATAVALAIAIFARAGARSPAAARGRGKGASTGVARTDVESRGGDREIALVSHLGICLVRFARKMNLPLGRVNGRVKKYHKIGIEGVPDFGSIVFGTLLSKPLRYLPAASTVTSKDEYQIHATASNLRQIHQKNYPNVPREKSCCPSTRCW